MLRLCLMFSSTPCYKRNLLGPRMKCAIPRWVMCGCHLRKWHAVESQCLITMKHCDFREGLGVMHGCLVMRRFLGSGGAEGHCSTV